MRIAVVADFREEEWASMDLVAAMLTAELREQFRTDTVIELQPRMRRVAGRLPLPARLGFNADRLFGRFVTYPRILRHVSRDFDIFHVVDHSYAHLALDVPPERSVVTCHDLDAFRGVLPGGEAGPVLRWMANRSLEGLRRASRVIAVSGTTRDELIGNGLVEAQRIRVIHNGVHPSCSPEPDAEADRRIDALLGPKDGQKREILHVGTTVSRKRIDVLLQAFAFAAEGLPELRLIKAGGKLTAEQRTMAERLGIADRVAELPFLSRGELAALYRRCDLLLQPSEREGFGLPVIEALASGLPVLASDLPVFREVAGAAVAYAPVGDSAAWAEGMVDLLREEREDAEAWGDRRAAGIEHAHGFSWKENARQTMALYKEMVD